MPNLISPGVAITVTDESYYDSSAPGSVPLIVLATETNKVSPTGAGLAPYTLSENAGKLFVATSQRELITAFGNPIFRTSGGISLHGSELNEYGLHAAYQFLGVANRAYILRADIDTAQLKSSDSAPKGAPIGGTFWFNPNETSFGVFKSNGKAVPGEAWVAQTVKVAYEGQMAGGVPVVGFGSNGDLAVAVNSTSNFLFEKIGGIWYKVGSTEWNAATPTVVLGTASNPVLTNSHALSINGVTVTISSTTLVSLVTAINNASIPSIIAEAVNNALRITNLAGGDIVIANVSGTPLAALGLLAGTTKGNSLQITNSVQYPTGSVSGDVWIKGSPSNRGAKWKVRVYSAVAGTWQDVAAPFYESDAAAESAMGGEPVEGAVYIRFDTVTGAMQLRRYGGDAFAQLVYEVSKVSPTSDPAAGTMWYSTDFRADIMVGDGDQWLGYRNMYPQTDPAGVILKGSAPTLQSDNTPLVSNDLWIDTSKLEEYPLMYRYDAPTQRWKLIDNTDQTSPFGVIFGDARENSGKEIGSGHAEDSELAVDMLASNFADPDAPDPRAVPAGMLLFNTRYSTLNVKRWEPEYFRLGNFDANTDYTLETYTVGNTSVEFPALANAGRWVTISGNRADGSPLMARRAQRAVIVKAMAEALNASEDARSEIVSFNLIAAPGYAELIDEMTALNVDQGETAFIIGDTPSRLAPDAQSLSGWVNNVYGAVSNGEDALVSNSPYVGVYYPWGMSSNIDGSDVMIPPSTMALRVMAYNDQVSYPWFAPAGFTRGLVNNATTVGFLTSEEEFRPVLLSPGQRDTLYANGINPIALVPNRGLIVYGQKTRSPVATAMDRINVARLINYLRTSLDLLVKPFLFEQNDEQTRSSVQLTVDRFLNGLVGLRGLEDYAVQCNTDNNTSERIDRNELWVDIAIRPTKSVEFIYVPIRITNTRTEL